MDTQSRSMGLKNQRLASTHRSDYEEGGPGIRSIGPNLDQWTYSSSIMSAALWLRDFSYLSANMRAAPTLCKPFRFQSACQKRSAGLFAEATDSHVKETHADCVVECWLLPQAFRPAIHPHKLIHIILCPAVIRTRLRSGFFFHI